LIFAAIIAMSVAWADTSLADCQRKVARYCCTKYKNPTQTIWFQGHWGFQYYMESFGAKPIDVKSSIIKKEDIVIMPYNNTNVIPLPGAVVESIEKLSLMPCEWLTTHSVKAGASFYSDEYGALPFLFGSTNPEEYNISMARMRFDFIIK